MRQPVHYPAHAIAAVAANLLLVAAARQVPDPNWRPSQAPHDLRQPAAGTSSATALENLQMVEQRLRLIRSIPSSPT